MLQRIQTVFMFLAIVMGVLTFFFPIATYFSETVYFQYFLYEIRNLSPDPFNEMGVVSGGISDWFVLPLALLQVVILALIFITIFRYRKRLLQIRLNYLTIFLNVLLVGGIFYASTMLEQESQTRPDYGLGGIFPLITIILIFLANNYIRKDERLIRSADRLR
ncbi:MAG: DUF4293 domain-containing protein [Bacteroidales bacterium]